MRCNWKQLEESLQVAHDVYTAYYLKHCPPGCYWPRISASISIRQYRPMH